VECIHSNIAWLKEGYVVWGVANGHIGSRERNAMQWS